MEYLIKVKNLDNRASWSKPLSVEEYNECKNHCAQSRYTIYGIEPLIYPVRANSFKNFAKDFFFPSLINLALKVDSFILGLFAATLALALDIVTLPIRAVTTLPMAFFNACRCEQSLKTYLKQQNVDSHLFESDSVKVTLVETEVIDEATKKQTRNKGFVNFIQVPWSPVSEPLEESKWSCVKVNDAWHHLRT